MKNVIILIISIFGLFKSFTGYSQCTHTIQLTDTWGDGWNGGTVSVSVNGTVVLTNITLASGAGPANFTFTASTGQTIRVFRTAAGSFPGEMRVRVNNNAGTAVIALVQPVNGTATTGGSTGTGSCVVPPTPPINDLVCSASVLGCGGTLAGTTVNATNSGTGEGGSCGTAQTQPGVWYVVAGNGQIMTASLCATAWDSKISVYSGPNCSTLTCVGGVDDNGPACASSSASYSWNSVLGTNYYVLVHGYGSTSAFSINLSCSAPATPPANDLVCSATAITCGQTIAGTTINATNSGTGEAGSCGTTQGYPGVWYSVVGNGQTMTASLCGTAWDSKISVFSGPNCSTLTCVGGVDDNGPACTGASASYSWSSVSGTTYYILVHGFNTNSAFNVNLTCSSPAWTDAWVSMNTGSSNWCAGETRTISVTVTNTGTNTWTNASPDINIGVKWNAEADYFVRTDANGLASGATQTYFFNVTAPMTLGSNNLSFDVVNEANFWFANNINGGGPGNVVFTSPAITINPYPTVTASADVTACHGQQAQLNASGSAGSGNLAVTISGIGFLDEISWTLTNSLGTVIGSGGNYPTGSTNVIPIGSAANGPYSFYLEAQGTFNDNDVDYNITCNGISVLSGSVLGGGTTTQSVSSCVSTATVSYAWSPTTGLNNSAIANPIATPGATTTYTVTATVNGCSATDQVDVILPTAGTALGNDNESATCLVNQNGWIHFYHSSGRLLASINSLGQDLGNVSVTSYVDVTNASVPACSNSNPIYNTSVMQRHWVITPSIQPSTPVQIRLPYSNAEFSSLTGISTVNANPNDDVFIPADVKLNKYSGPLNVNASALDNCSGAGGSGGTTQHNPTASGVATAYSTVGSAYYSEFSIPGFSEFWLNGNLSASPLPVELVSFNANCLENGSIDVSWVTATEHNASHYVVDKSVEGTTWATVATVQAAGNSTTTLNYSLNDAERKAGDVYYRLTQYDVDGKNKVYDPISIDCSTDITKSTIVTYPNPSSNSFYVELNAVNAEGFAILSIIDVHGSVVSSRSIEVKKGLTVISVDDLTVSPGMYYISVQSENDKFELVKHIVK